MLSEKDRMLDDRLTVLLGLNELLLEKAFGPLTAKQERILENLRRSTLDVWALLGRGDTRGGGTRRS